MNSWITPVPLNLSRELFHQTYLTASHYPDKDLIEGAIAVLVLLDFCIGVIRVPYLLMEAHRIQKVIQEGETLQSSSELRYQVLSLVSNALEIVIWTHERKWVELSNKQQRHLKVTSVLCQVILFEQAVRKETVAYFQAYRAQKEDPGLSQRGEYKHLKMSVISHSAFLGWSTLQLLTLIKGVPYPRPLQKLLHLTSVVFGLLAMGYDSQSEVNRCFKWLAKQLVKEDIY